MPQTHDPQRRRRRGRLGRPGRCRCSARRSTSALIHQAVVRQLAGAPDRHRRHADPRRGPRRRPQAVAPEGHRPRSTGHPSRAAVGRRRRGLRTAPARLRRRRCRPRCAAPRCAASLSAQGRPTGAVRVVEGSAWTRSRPSRCSSGWPPGRRRARCSSSCRRATSRGALVPQPARGARDPGRQPERRRPARSRHRSSSPATRSIARQEVYA